MDDILKLKYEFFHVKTLLNNERLRCDHYRMVEIPKLKNEINALKARVASLLLENDELKAKNYETNN